MSTQLAPGLAAQTAEAVDRNFDAQLADRSSLLAIPSTQLAPGLAARIAEAVDRNFDAQLADTSALVAIPSTRGAESPAQDFIAGLLRARGYAIDDWTIDMVDLEGLPDCGVIEDDFSRARTVVGTYRPPEETGRSLILQGHCDVVPTGAHAMWETPAFKAVVKDGWLHGRGAGDMKSGTIAALYALDALRDAGVAPRGRIHFQSVIEEESTGVGALSTLQRGYRADCALLPEPTGQIFNGVCVGVIWFRLKVSGEPTHVAVAGEGSNAIKAAYRLIMGLEELEAEWNERARADKYYGTMAHPINFNPGIIKGGDWASVRAGLVRCRLPHRRPARLECGRMPPGDRSLRGQGRIVSPLSREQPAQDRVVWLPLTRLCARRRARD